MSDSLGTDLNKVIAAGVEAKIEAAVAGALLSEDTFAKFVVAALQQPIEVGSSYNKTKTTFLRHTLNSTIEKRTKEVVAEEIIAAEDQIRAEVRKALKKSIGVLADSLVDGFVAQAHGSYPSIKVSFGDN